MSRIAQSFAEHNAVIKRFQENCLEDVATIGNLMVEVLRNGGTIFWCGNGGSAADSQHLAAELVGRFQRDRLPLRSIALSTDSSILTSVANDFAFEKIFERQIQALGRPGDILVGISTSGNSENVLHAFRAGKALGLHTVGLFGNDGGKGRTLPDYSVIVESISVARIQEVHILIGHCLCDFIEHGLGLLERD